MKMNIHRSAESVALYNLSDVKAKGRFCILLASILSNIVLNLTTGVFLTGFLLAAGLDVVQVGALSMIPYLMSLCSLFSPMLFARLQKRKSVLLCGKLLGYAVNLLALSLVPVFAKEKSVVFVLFVVCFIVANGVNMFIASGYSAWHYQLLPENVRAGFFTAQQILCGIMSSVALIISGIISDTLLREGNSAEFFICLRIIMMVVAIGDAVVLWLPKEEKYPVEAGAANPLSLIRVPFRHKRYIGAMGLIFLWNFLAFLPATAQDAHIIQDVGIPYMFITFTSASNSIILICCAPIWKRLLKKTSWLKTLALALLLHAPFSAALGFLTNANYFWLYPSGRVCQLIAYVGIAITMANLPYLTLPKQDQTSCLSFFVLISNAGAFFGQSGGTIIVSAFQDLAFPVGKTEFGIETVLMITQGVLMLILASCAFFGEKWLLQKESKTEEIAYKIREDDILEADFDH